MSIESIKQEIKAEIGKLQQILALLGAETGHGVVAKNRAASTKPRRGMSAAGRKRIAAAQRARWEKIRAGKK
ncbi:MAG TPA: hypothetical protein VKR59_10950 [Terriglobales bacterium]|nr:hypothetical protein [Terriglobales bacterium]